MTWKFNEQNMFFLFVFVFRYSNILYKPEQIHRYVSMYCILIIADRIQYKALMGQTNTCRYTLGLKNN